MKIHEMMDSKYLKKEEVGEDGTVVTIEGFERVNVAPDDKPEELKWIMHTREFDKPLIINTTNLKLCERVLGSDDTDDYIGKQIVLYNEPNITFGDKLVGGIRVKAHRKAAPPRQITKPSQAVHKPIVSDDDNDPAYDPGAFEQR